MIVSMNVSHFVKICQVLTILHQLSVGVSLILGHGVEVVVVVVVAAAAAVVVISDMKLVIELDSNTWC